MPNTLGQPTSAEVSANTLIPSIGHSTRGSRAQNNQKKDQTCNFELKFKQDKEDQLGWEPQALSQDNWQQPVKSFKNQARLRSAVETGSKGRFG